LSDSIIKIPATGEPEEYLFALDAFLFPSVFEGVGIAAIEAQCAGLPMIVARHLPDELAVSDLVHWEDKADGATRWASSLAALTRNTCREKYAQIVARAGYSAAAVALHLLEIYQGRNKNG